LRRRLSVAVGTVQARPSPYLPGIRSRGSQVAVVAYGLQESTGREPWARSVARL
jgi:hypothetical protein